MYPSDTVIALRVCDGQAAGPTAAVMRLRPPDHRLRDSGNPNAGFGGKGESGMGRTRGKHSFDAFTHFKTVGYQSTSSDPKIRYPPYKVGYNVLCMCLMPYGALTGHRPQC